MSFAADALRYVGLFLQVILVVLLLLGPFRRYPVLFIYTGAQLVSSAVLQWMLLKSDPRFRFTYWLSEVLIDLLLFLVVITQIYKVLGKSPHRAKIGKMLAVVVVAEMVLPFLIYYQRQVFSTAWFNGTSQLLNFGVAVMTLVLWAVLIGSRDRDFRILAVSAGLGLAVTGSAVSFGLRQFTIDNALGREAANLIGQITYVLAVAVWCRAFWPKAQPHIPQVSSSAG
jgi:hypothetical protein